MTEKEKERLEELRAECMCRIFENVPLITYLTEKEVLEFNLLIEKEEKEEE